MISFLGWTGVLLSLVLGSLFLVRKLNKANKSKNPNLIKLLYFIKKIHPIAGILLLSFGLAHGNMAMGRLILHTGTILWFCVLVMFFVISLFKITKKRKYYRIHKYLALVFFLLLGIHIFARNII